MDNLCLVGTRSFASWSIPVCLCISKAMLGIIYIGLQEKALLQPFRPGHLKLLKTWVEGTIYKFGWREPLAHEKKPLLDTTQDIPIWRPNCLRKLVIPFSYNSY